jgi:hypothetical protein
MWRNMDLGLNWSSPSTRETKKLEALHHHHAKKLEALHHYQHLSTLQNTEKPNTTVNQENKTESCSFLGRIRKLGKAARMKILELLHGKSKIMSSPAGRVLVGILALSVMPATFLILWLIIQLCAILLCLSHSLLISMAIMLIHRQDPNEEENTGTLGSAMINGARESEKSAREPNERTTEPELQDRILMEKLEDNDRRISALTSGQISLGARVASWEESTPISHG